MTKLINKNTKLCMSLADRPGNFGTFFHNYLYNLLDLDYMYKAFTTRSLKDAIRGIRALDIRGCAISMPYKEACIPLLDELDKSAESIQSVNTIVNIYSYLIGYNTDYIAIINLLKQNKVSSKTPFIVKGSGGMAKAVVGALHDQKFKKGVILARNQQKGSELANLYGYQYLSHEAQLDDCTGAMIINVTPIGMAGGKEEYDLSFSQKLIEQAAIVFDVIALPVETPLIKAAKALNKITISGGDVAIIQALEQFVLYTFQRPTSAQVKEAAAFARSNGA